MPHFDMTQLVFLGLVIAAFGAFAVTLLAVSLYVGSADRAENAPEERHVIPAKRTEGAIHN